jgi:endonuclease YncB( thermonuclease family)
MYPLVALVVALAVGAAHATIAGVASVTDGDTIQIHGQSIRLHAVDAPEGGQPCQLDGKPWRCGSAAANALAEFLDRRTVTCEPRTRDRYGRTVAVCTVAGQDVGAWLVREGWALAFRNYSSDYVDEEKAARMASRGLWRGAFTPPWQWRAERYAQRRPSTPPDSRGPRGCRIKGNVNAKGKAIYHRPGDRDYEETRIDPSKGERWFCSEDEAKAAGWRRAQQ